MKNNNINYLNFHVQIRWWLKNNLRLGTMHIWTLTLEVLCKILAMEFILSNRDWPIREIWRRFGSLCKKDLNDPDNHEGVITHLEPDILECDIKWALGSIIANKASGGDGILVELFQILKGDAVKVLHSICQQIWKTQQWPQDWKRSVFIPIPKKSSTKECSNYHTVALISNACKVMLKILQARLQ